MTPSESGASVPLAHSGSGVTTMPGRFPADDPCSQRSSSSGLPTVADRPIRCRGCPQSRVRRSSTASRCQPAVAGAERVDLVHDDGLQPGEQPVVIDVDADQHGLKRLGRGEQEVRRVSQHGPPARAGGVAMPERYPPARPAAIGLQSRQQIVEQRLQRAQVEHRQPGPVLRRPSGTARGRRRPRSCRPRWARAAARPRPAVRARSPPAGAGAARSSRACRPGGAQAWDAARPAGSVTGRVPRSSAVAGRNAAAFRSTSVSSVRGQGELVVLPRVEVGELGDPVQHVGDQLAQEDARRDADLPA